MSVLRGFQGVSIKIWQNEKKSRDVNKRESCLKKIGDILKNEFNVFIRLRAFSVKEAYITALD